MAWETWRTVKQQVCERIGEQVALEVRVVYPANFLPDSAPRVLGHRCSHGLVCNQMDKPSCQWAGTLPGYDPFH